MNLRNQVDMLFFERAACSRGFTRIAGIDEAGRGPLAGPVVAAAVILPPDLEISELNDSKQLSASIRYRLARSLQQQLAPGTWAIAVVEAAEIDRLNILGATHLAMRQALSRLDPQPGFALVDGLPVDKLGKPSQAVVKGDGKSASIAAASIMAKVHRDTLMEDYDRHYPEYGFADHKGYATKKHLKALRRLGPCHLHRRSFAPVASCRLDFPVQTEFAFMDIPDDS